MSESKGKILVVDDEPDQLTLLADCLAARGYQVHTATSAMAGLNQARKHLPDLVLLDVMLGDLDGFSACEILHRQPSTARTPVIIMTAMGGEMARFNSFAAGAVAFMPKPISPRALAQRVDAMLHPQPDPFDAPPPPEP